MPVLFDLRTYLFDMELQDIDHQISITSQQLAYEKDPNKKTELGKKIQKLRLQREIATIKKRIEALSK
jgi:hypothetical protein